MNALLHIVTARLCAGAPPGAVASAIERARALLGAPGVHAVTVGLSEHELVVATWLAGRESLEAFAASPQHMSFVMQGVAPVIERMWTAVAETADGPIDAGAGRLWTFALPEHEGVYEWQVRDLLAAIVELPGRAAAGVTVEERDRFRAAGLLYVPEAGFPAFAAALELARARWREVVGPLEEACVPVLPA